MPGLRRSGPPRVHRLAVVPYLNAPPLIWGLDDSGQVDLLRAVPSELRGKLAGGQVQAALLPSIDLQRFEQSLTVIPAGCIASAGMTLTELQPFLLQRGVPEETASPVGQGPHVADLAG